MTESLRLIPVGVPGHAGTAGNEKGKEWTKMAARNERGSEQLTYEFPGPSEEVSPSGSGSMHAHR